MAATPACLGGGAYHGAFWVRRWPAGWGVGVGL